VAEKGCPERPSGSRIRAGPDGPGWSIASDGKLASTEPELLRLKGRRGVSPGIRLAGPSVDLVSVREGSERRQQTTPVNALALVNNPLVP